MDDSRIRNKTAPFSFENGLVWTRPKREATPRETTIILNKKILLQISSTPISFQFGYQFQNYFIREFVKSAVLLPWFTFDSISAIKLVKWVVPSPCEKRPNNNKKNE